MTTTHDKVDGFLPQSKVAELEGQTTRTLRNRVDRGDFPGPDAIRDGIPLWLTSTYRKYQADLIAGKYQRRDRIAHLRGRTEAA